MRVSINSYRGEVPRVSPRLLPDNAAQDATNARLLTGDLEAWRQFAEEKALANPSGPILSISKINGAWMSWDADVDVARGAIAGDTTFRTFLTGPDVYDRPQFTTYAMATGGPEPYPFETRPLGVPAPVSAPTVVPGVDPNPTTFAIDILDEGDELATSWTVSPVRGGATYSEVLQVSSPFQAYLMQYDEIHNAGEEPYLYRNFGIASATVVRLAAQFMLVDGGQNFRMVGQANSSAEGLYASYGGGAIAVGISSGWGIYSAVNLSTAAVSISAGVLYDMELSIISNGDGTKTATATLYEGSVQLAQCSGSTDILGGDYAGFSSASPDDFGAPAKCYVTNIVVQASGATGYNPVNIATSYVYTFKNDLGQESAPSFASVTVLRPDGISITVTTPTDVPTGVDPDFQVQTKAIYRAVTGSTGTVYRFVAEIPLAQADYIDSVPETELGEVLQSEGWALPPEDLRGILALPNGVMAGFSKNQLCFSARNQPHAWPVAYRLNTDTDIVAIGAIDTVVVIGTENFIYLAIGTDPAAYSMTKLEVPQACVAKRSLAYLIGIGVVFASPDGLIAVAGNGSVRNLTSGVFTREQWQALAPETVLGIAHDDVYHFWASPAASGPQEGYMLSMKADGFGLVPTAYHATAAYADPLTDNLYLVLDSDDEPTDDLLPLPSTAPAPDGLTVFTFNAENGDGHMVYRWRGKLYLLPHPAAFVYCQVRAESYENIVLRLYADEAVLLEMQITSNEVFTLPLVDDYDRFEIEIVGTSRVYTVQVAEDVSEFD